MFHYKEMTLKISIQDGTKLENLPVKYSREMSWRVRSRRRDESLQTTRTRSLRSQNERMSRVTKGRKSAKKGDWENVTSGKQMDSLHEETLAVSATEVVVDNEHNRSLLLRRCKHRLAEESF